MQQLEGRQSITFKLAPHLCIQASSFWVIQHVIGPMNVLYCTSFTTKWVPQSNAMLYEIPCLWIKHSVSPQIVVLSKALRTGKVNFYPVDVLILVKMNFCAL